MYRTVPAALLLVLLVAACGDDRAGRDGAAAPRPETTDLTKAVSLALPAFDQARRGTEPFQLIGAEQMILDGNYVWRMTFKATHLLPEDPSAGMVGLGGEIFVNVDLQSGTATHGYGE